MSVAGSRVAIVGGSIAGCAAGIALDRLGCEVHIFERSSGALKDRGSGIAIPIPLRDELIAAGYLPADYPSCEPTSRLWVLADGTDAGRKLWRQSGTAALSNWGVLWRSLRAAASHLSYHDDAYIAAVTSRGRDGATIEFDDGRSADYDVVVGADGYRSIVRDAIYPHSSPEYAGYILWRGNFPESQLKDRAGMDSLDAAGSWLTVCFDGGHGVVYPIPGFEDASKGARRVNWAVYAKQPDGLDFTEPTSIPPGGVEIDLFRHFEELIERAFPPLYRPLFGSPRSGVSIQPIYDQLADSYVRDRIVLIGDAGTLSRPHTGSGATKAMQDARTLERLGQEHPDWESLLPAYDLDRTTTGDALVELGRRIGRDQVEQTPPWGQMAVADFEAWTAATLSGQQLYFYGDSKDDAAEATAPTQ
jgi:2-polyprenyl-6-methoxyphenol hydroxylase-like FAD-dependent oxidoreductase